MEICDRMRGRRRDGNNLDDTVEAAAVSLSATLLHETRSLLTDLCHLGRLPLPAVSDQRLAELLESFAPSASSGDVAIGGKRGNAVEGMLEASVRYGSAVLAEICRSAVARLLAKGGIGAQQAAGLFTDEERQQLADALAAVNGTADQLARAQIRDYLRIMEERYGGEAQESVSRLDDWLSECGGKGGKPGPCPEGDKKKTAKPRKAAEQKPAAPQHATPSDPLDLTPQNVKGVWEKNRDEILASDPKMSESQAGSLAAARVLNNVRDRAAGYIASIDAKVARGEPISDAEDAKYMAAGDVRKNLHGPLADMSGYRPHELLDEHPLARKPLAGAVVGPKVGDVVDIPALDNRMAFQAKFFPGSKPDTVGIGYSDSKRAYAEMPAASAKHFVNDLSGKVDVPPNSGHAAIDAVASGKGELLGKGNDGLVFGVGDKVVKVSTTVPFQPLNAGHVSPEEAANRLASQVKVNNSLAEKGIPGLLKQEFVSHGDKAFAIRDKLDIPETLTPNQLADVRKTIDGIHAAGYVVGDDIQVGVKKGKPYLYDLGAAQVARDKRDFDDDNSRFDRLAELSNRKESTADSPGWLTESAPDRPFKPLPPEQAVDYFKSLVPTLGTDPDFFGEAMRRQAFTLAVQTEAEILGKVQASILDILSTGTGVSAAPKVIAKVLTDAGITETVGGRKVNGGYAEMVWRTNALNAYNTAADEERMDPDVIGSFPVWRYSSVADGRSRPHHAARDGLFYPASVSFMEVRGTDIGEAANCRCTSIPVYRSEWERLQANGAQVETQW